MKTGEYLPKGLTSRQRNYANSLMKQHFKKTSFAQLNQDQLSWICEQAINYTPPSEIHPPTAEELAARNRALYANFNSETLFMYAHNLLNGLPGYDRATFDTLVKYADTIGMIGKEEDTKTEIDKDVLMEILNKLEPTKKIKTV